MIPHVNESKEEFEEVDLKYNYQQIKHVKWQDKILLNRPLKVGLVFFLLAIVAPVLIYRYYFFTTLNLPPSDGYSAGSCLIPRDMRLSCGLGFVTQEECHPQCCYDLNLSMCYHRIPSRFSYILNQAWNEYVTLQPRISTVPFSFQNSEPELKLSIDEISSTHMAITFYNSRNTTLIGNKMYNKDYEYEVSSPEMNVVVYGKQGAIFDMGRGPLIASNNIWEIAFKLTNETMYGFGEIPIKTNTSRVIYSSRNVSSIPLIFAKSNNSFHGLLIDISDPTEVTILPDSQIVIRSITNFGFKFHLFTGPEPKKIMEDVMLITGTNKQLEYWMLGTHICNEVPGMDLRNFISNATSIRMAYDSLCGDGPIIFNSDQCASSNISNIESVNNDATLVRNAGKKFVPHVSPFIRYYRDEINETLPDEENMTRIMEDIESCKIIPVFEDKMYHLPTMEMYTGEVDDNEVLYPNYDEESDELMDSLWAYTTQFHGLILENNWPLDQAERGVINETKAYFPYFSENFEKAFMNTPQWNITLINSTEPYLFRHNMYGDSFVNTVSRKFNNTPLWSSSLWMNSRFAINRQGIDVSWTNLHKELISAALGGISGSWLWSTPICGDTENFDPDSQSLLCVKWYMAATYFPMIKIHSKEVPRHPLAFNGTYRTIVTDALSKRIGFIPYFYTVLQEGPLLRPMFYQFPTSTALHNINTQFSVGDSLLIAPNLQPFQTHVHIWLPPGTWYEFWSGIKLEGDEGDPITLTTTDSDFITFIRGGSILLYQASPTSLTSEDARWNTPFSVTIALECNLYEEVKTCQAYGKQYISPDMTLHFSANERNMTITANGTDLDPICDWNSGTWAYNIEYFKIYGLDEEYNNFDNHRYFKTFIDICLLERSSEIVVDLLS